MRDRRLRPGKRWAIGLVLLLAVGCSQEEELKPDPGVSPFYPGPSAESKAPSGTLVPGNGADRGTVAATDAEGPIRPQDVEKVLRTALRAGEKGDYARAASLLDRILAVEPMNREALFGRAALALTEEQRATSPQQRLAEIERAAALVKTLRRDYEKPNPRELELAARVNQEQLRVYVGQDRLDQAVAVVKEVYEAHFDPFDVIERDPDMAKLRAFKGYQDFHKGAQAERLARARSRAQQEFARTPNFKFTFNTKDLDGKPISLDHYKGKVLLIDIWGTWCRPCVETIPALVQLYQKQRSRGLEVIGLDYEKDETDPAQTREHVKSVAKQLKITYPIAPFVDEMRDQIPDFQAFPTTLILDRTGKVRIYLAGGGPEAVAVIDAAVEILLSEPDAKPGAPAPADAKAGAKPK
jgi:thiol-disulfide isomerase/thioredoxin